MPAPLLVLCRQLELADVPYCVLPARAGARNAPSMANSLELLIDRARATDAEHLVAGAGFHRLRTPRAHGGSTHDFLALDHGPCALVQLRVRHALPVRRAPDERLRLPWEHAVLATRRRAANGLFVPADDPNLLLTAVWNHTERNGSNEAAGLRSATLLESTRRLLGPTAAAALPDLDAAVQTGLPAFRSNAPWPRFTRWLQQVRGRMFEARSVPASGGLCLAFVGCDGSGKSTVTAELARWLSEWLRVDRIYLGSGQGSSSLLRWPLLLVHRLMTRLRPQTRVAAQPDAGPTPTVAVTPHSGLRYRLRPIWALVLALEKRQKLRAAWRARQSGAVVVCDRYPQNEIMGFNDGPLLAGWDQHRSRWRRALARWERRPYEWAASHPPDLVVKLHVSPEVALARKPDMSAAEVGRRIAAIDALTFGDATRTLRIDADAPLATVLREAKAGIWKEL